MRKRSVESRRLVALLGAVCIAVGLACAGGNGESQSGGGAAFPDSIRDTELVVTVNNHPIYGRDLRVFAMVYQPASADSMGYRQYHLRVMNQVVDRTLLWQEARARGLAPDDSTMQWFVREFVRTMGGPEALDEQLSLARVSRFDLEVLMKKDLIVRRFLETAFAGQEPVTSENARKHYTENPSLFTPPDSVRARHILLLVKPTDPDSLKNAKRTAIDVALQRARAGEDFADLAQQLSEGPSRTRGGDLGYFTFSGMVRPFAEVAFALKPGEISGVVQTSFGYHIIKSVDYREGTLAPFEQVEERLLQQLQQYATAADLQAHLKRVRSAAILEQHF